MTISYDEMILILKSDDLFEKEDKVSFTIKYYY